MPYQTHYKELTPEEIQAHADWYESIVIVDEQGNELPVVLLDDIDDGEDGDTDMEEE